MHFDETPMKPPLLLSKIEISGWRSISKATIFFLRNNSPRYLSILVGENGAGKTSVLRAIALSTVPALEATALTSELTGTQRRINRTGSITNEAEIKATFIDSSSNEYIVITRIVTTKDGRETLERTTTPENFPWDRIVSAGYGVGRGVRGSAEIGKYDRRQALISLFKDDAALFDGESVLKSVALDDRKENSTNEFITQSNSESKGKGPFPTLQYFKWTVRKLFRLNPNHEIEVSSRGVLVHGPWGAQPFHALGDGYRSTAGWVLDFLGRFWSANIEGKVSGEPSGIVLVDEVDEHLHPSWSREIYRLLQGAFPKVQFITTTHSPIPLTSIQPDELILIEQKNTITTVHQDLPDTSTKTIDTLLRGKWFGLAKTMDDQTEALLKKYKEDLRRGEIEQIEKSRDKLQARAPFLVASPIEELALRAAESIRQESGPDVPIETREILARLRQDLEQLKKNTSK